MKVVKLKAGYRITCADSEIEALRFMLSHGQPSALERDQQSGLSNAAKAVIRRAPFGVSGGPLIVTDDRRSA